MSKTIASVTALLALLATLPAIAPEAAALGTYTIGNGEILTSSISADTILLPAGYVAYWTSDITLTATTTIDLRGQLIDYADGAPRNINLISSKDIVIGGWIVGAGGHDRANQSANASFTGEAGGDGASIYLQWGALGQFTLAAGARLESGAGGRGANVSILSDNASSPQIVAAAGPGGRGGDITFNGVSMNVYGTVAYGNGGAGGRLIMTLAPNATLHSDANWTGNGGAGGPSGNSPQMVAPCFTFSCAGGDGGTGGAACVIFALGASPPPENSRECPQIVPELNLSGIEGPSAPSCNTETKVNGGKGGDGGLNGGNGGDAIAEGCDGMNGVPGSIGQNGSDGGSAGDGTATGGDGGFGPASGGRGGKGDGRGGKGGDGGPGGIGASGGNGGRGGDGRGVGGNGGASYCAPGDGGPGIASRGKGGGGGQGGIGGGNGNEGVDGSSSQSAGGKGTGGGFCHP